MADLMAGCCIGSEFQHGEWEPCPQDVAAKLSEAQRVDMLASHGGERFWTADGRTLRALQRKGIIGTADIANRASWTPLGLSVRKVLEAQS